VAGRRGGGHVQREDAECEMEGDDVGPAGNEVEFRERAHARVRSGRSGCVCLAWEGVCSFGRTLAEERRGISGLHGCIARSKEGGFPVYAERKSWVEGQRYIIKEQKMKI
jgi:hypothetical protein